MKRIIRLVRHILHEIVVYLTPNQFKRKMLSCEQVSRLLTSKEDLKALKKIQLKMHLFICQCCIDYQEQLNIIQSQTHQLALVKLTDEQKSKANISQEKLLQQLKAPLK